MKEFLKYVVPFLLLIAVAVISSSLEVKAPHIYFFSIAFYALYLFHLDNPHKKHQTSISILFVLWAVVHSLKTEFGLNSIFPNLILLILAIIYSVRFYLREDKHPVDYMKVVSIVAFMIASFVKPTFISFILPIVAFSYLLDRLIIRRQMSKTLQITAFAVMGLVTITFIVYGRIKANEAQKSAETAKTALLQAQAEAQRQSEIAQQMAVNVSIARAEAEKAAAELLECQSK